MLTLTACIRMPYSIAIGYYLDEFSAIIPGSSRILFTFVWAEKADEM